MTVAPVITESTYALIGTALGPFSTVWPYEDTDDITVWLDLGAGPAGLSLGVDFTVFGAAVTLSALLIPVAGVWPAGATISLARLTPDGQPSAFGEAGTFSPAACEAALDDLARQEQERLTASRRALSLPFGEQAPTWPPARSRAGLILMCDGYGVPNWTQLPTVVVYDPVSVLQFGADPTGATSSLNAFNAAIAWANTNASGSPGGALKGITIGVPDGRYKIDGNLDPIVQPMVTFKGQSMGGAVLNLSGAGSAFTWSAGAYGGGLSNLTLQYKAAPANTAAVATLSHAGSQVFENLFVFNINTLAVLGTDASHTATNITFKQILGYCYNSGKPCFKVGWGSALFLDALNIYVDGVAVPALTRVSTMTTVAGTNFIECKQGGWDLLVISGGTVCNRFWSGLYINAPGSVFSNFTVKDGGAFDYCSSDAVSLNAATNATGGIFHVDLGPLYLVSWSGSGILLTGDNPNAQHDFSGVNIYIAGHHGISIDGLATRNIKMIGCRLGNVNRIAGAYSGINIGVTLGHYVVQGCTCLDDPSGAFGWSATYGITLAADTDYYLVTGNELVGSTKNYNIPLEDTTQSFNRLVHDNLRADYAKWQTTGIFTLIASATNWINKTPFKVLVAVSGMDTGVGVSDRAGTMADLLPAVGGSGFTKGPSSFAFEVEPGCLFRVGYSDVAFAKMQFKIAA